MIKISISDITKRKTDVIVNAANSYLKHGSGVAAAISAAGGDNFQKESDKIVEVQGPISPGMVVEQPSSGLLQSDYIIHAVGPIYENGKNGEAEQLFSCYVNAIKKAADLGARSISFPAISCGIFSYPAKEAAAIAIEAIAESLKTNDIELVEICILESQQTAPVIEAFIDALNQQLNPFWPYLKEDDRREVIYREYPLSIDVTAQLVGLNRDELADFYRLGALPSRKSIGEPEIFAAGLIVGFCLSRISQEDRLELKKIISSYQDPSNALIAFLNRD